jgi:hypothetical protein
MNALERVSARDPMRCQGNNGQGPCSYRAVPGSQFCPLHGGSMTAIATSKHALRNYILQADIGQRAQELANNPNLKNLTDEIALSRLTLENIFKQIKTSTDFLLFSDKITSILNVTKNLIESYQKIQERNRELVDRATLFTIAEGILAIIVNFIKDPDEQKAAGELIYECIIKGLGGSI